MIISNHYFTNFGNKLVLSSGKIHEFMANNTSHYYKV